ncbi:heterokaryon incompatibility protein-domain-containing protein [Xylogone sp. PMI_703]|nr:heterokaryon incompatibility protein-domain-containing protein [Xylogone sp. PMI_703]
MKLKSELQEVRILSIMKGHQWTEIECTLEHVSLRAGLKYKALSYTWGNPSEISYIKLNDQPFPVTITLAAALQHLRKETETVELWVDAICINQQDTDEKNVQVRRMKEIYETAKEVIIWLGPESDDSGYAMEAINGVDRGWANADSQPVKERLPAAPTLDKRTLQAINQLLCRPWWRRVWIIQEATCASTTYLKCGSHQIEFIAVMAMVNFVMQDILKGAVRDFSTPDTGHFSRPIALQTLKFNRSQSEYRMDFLSLLDDSRVCEASDPRDKVFALSGLTTDAQREARNPDYSLSVDVVYIRLVNTLIKSEPSLNILGHCQAAVQDPNSWSSFKLLSSSLLPKRPLPSWTPDWTMDPDATPFMKYE